MPDIALCANKCDVWNCVRHPAQYKPEPHQCFMYCEGTKYCVKTQVSQHFDTFLEAQKEGAGTNE